jgi:hypothetical protein
LDSTKLNHWLQILGMFGIMASLVFVGMQVKQTDVIASIEGQDNAVQRHYDMLSLMTEHAEVWQRGCSGAELNATERTQFTKIFSVYANNNFAGWRRLELSDYRDSKSDYNINAFAANLHRYPGLAAVYRSSTEWDKTGFGDDLGPSFEKYLFLIFARLEELAKIEPDPMYGTEWCGRT